MSKIANGLVGLNVDSIGLRKFRLIGTNIIAFDAVEYGRRGALLIGPSMSRVVLGF